MNYCDGVGQKGLVDCDPENGQCEICYMADLEEENEKLKAENESLRADAERYRHILANHSPHGYINVCMTEDEIDAELGKGEQP